MTRDIFTTISRNNYHFVSEALNQNFDFSIIDGMTGYTPLISAAEAGLFHIVNLILEKHLQIPSEELDKAISLTKEKLHYNVTRILETYKKNNESIELNGPKRRRLNP